MRLSLIINLNSSVYNVKPEKKKFNYLTEVITFTVINDTVRIHLTMNFHMTFCFLFCLLFSILLNWYLSLYPFFPSIISEDTHSIFSVAIIKLLKFMLNLGQSIYSFIVLPNNTSI